MGPVLELAARLDFPRDTPAGMQRGLEVLGASLAERGLEPAVMPFSSSPHRADAAAVALALGGLFVVAAAVRRAGRRRLVVMAAACVTAALLALGGGLDRFLPSRPAVNLELAIEPAGRARHELVLGAHLDSKTEPLDHVARSVLFVATGLAGAAALAAGAAGRARSATALGVVLAGGLLGSALQLGGGRFVTERSHGILDDGAAAMLLVDLAGEYRSRPPAATRLRFVWWSAEEAGAQGSAAWAAAEPRPGDLFAVNLECIGAGPELGYVTWEWTGRGLAPADAALVRLVGQAAPIGLRRFELPLVTDAGSCRRRRIPALTLLGLDAAGRPPRGLHGGRDRSAALDSLGTSRVASTLRALVEILDAPDG
jgi:hypothetical protein